MGYTPEQIEGFKTAIIEGLSCGKSLLSLQSEINLPSRPTIYNWLNEEHPDFDRLFLNNYTRAREESADYDHEYVLAIADKVEAGILSPEQARVIIDARKWSAGVKKPKKYGKQIDLTSGGDKINPVPSSITVNVVMPEDE